MRIGFVDYFLDEWHANNYPGWIRQASGGAMEVSCAYAMIDHPGSGRTTAQWCADNGVTHCATIEEVVAQSDAIIVLSSDNPEMQEALCQAPLRSGKPVYVDKTLSTDGEAARRLLAIAAESRTPCYSSSALRFADEYAVLGRNSITALTSIGPGLFDSYLIHQLEPVMMLMQAPAKRALAVQAKGWYTVVLAFVDGRMATLSGFANATAFTMNVCAGEDTQTIPIESDYFQPFIQTLITFFKTRHPPVSAEETIAIMDARGAAVRAMQAPGEWVEV